MVEVLSLKLKSWYLYLKKGLKEYLYRQAIMWMSLPQSGEIIRKSILHNDALVDHPGQQEDHLKETHPPMMIDLQRDDGHHLVHLQDLLIEEVAEEEEIIQGEESHHHLRVSPSSSSTSYKTGSEEGGHSQRTNERRVRPQRAWKRAQKFKEGGKDRYFFLPTTAPMDKWIRY